MIRIGIYGSENSHAMAFSELINGEESRFPNLQVVAIGGEESENSRKIADAFGATIVQSPAEMIGQIDAGMITSRDGALHLKYARPLIEAGLPLFVDKPVTSDPKDAVTLIDLAKAKGVPLLGGSSVKLIPDVQALGALRAGAERVLGGSVWAPVSMDNPYGGFYFYSAHLVEMCLEIFGMDACCVDAGLRSDIVTAVLHYPDFSVTCQFLEKSYHYGAALHIPGNTQLRAFSLDGCYELEVSRFARMLESGDMPVSYEALIQSVFVVEAIKTAYETGVRQPISGANERG